MIWTKQITVIIKNKNPTSLGYTVLQMQKPSYISG